MQKYHQTTPHRVQSIRLFSLIHQLNNSQTPTLNAFSIDKFLKSAGLSCKQDLIKFMHEIDKQNKQMRSEYWASCISRTLDKVKVTCQRDYLDLHSWIKMLLMGTFIQPLQGYQLWDGSQNKNNEEKDQEYARVLNYCGEISMYINKIDFMTFSKIISNVNSCFSLINLFPIKEGEILQIYEKIVTGTFLQTLQFALTMNAPENILIQMIKSLCYLYQSFKYEKIRKLLQSSFLVSPSTFTGLLHTINDKRPQVRYFTCALMALMVNNVPALPYLVLTNKQLLYNISNGIAQIRENQGLIFAIQFMLGIVRGFGELSQQEKAENISVINVYLNFAIGKLGELQSEKCQAACIKLVLEVIKVMDLTDDNLKLLKFIDTVFEGPNQIKFQALFEVTLEITKNSIIYKRKNVEKYIMDNKSFQSYLKTILKPNHEQWQPFYSALQTVLLISSSPESCDTLFKRDLIECIFSLSDTQNQAVLLYVSQIVLSLILNSLDSEWKTTYLHEKSCMKVIGQLILNSATRDIILYKQYGIEGVSYHNRRVFINALKSLHYLNFKAGNLVTLKKQHYIKNFSTFFIKSFSQGLLSLLNTTNSPQYLSYLLKQQHSLHRDINSHEAPTIKLSKLISTVVQQMTYNLRKRNTSLQILKLVDRIRNQLHKYLYTYLSYNELVVEDIPKYMRYVVSFNGRNAAQKAYRLRWNQFRAMLWEIVKKELGIQAEYFAIVDKATQREIRNEDDYRKELERVLSDYRTTNYVLDVQLLNIRQKQDIRDIIKTTGSMRGDDFFRRADMPRFNSSRMPPGRSNSPFSSWKGQSHRIPSPNFGTPCRQCNKITTNKSQICNSCVQNRFK